MKNVSTQIFHLERLSPFLLFQTVGELGGRTVNLRIFHLMNEDVKLALKLLKTMEREKNKH